MNAILIDRETLLHEDYTADLAAVLIAHFNALIDAELAKGDAADFDRIDAFADAINAIRENGITELLPVISNCTFLKTLGVRRRSAAPRIAAACAAAAIVLGIGAYLTTGAKTDVIQEAARYFRNIFHPQTVSEPATQPEPETTALQLTEPATTSAPEAITGITLAFDDMFRREYGVGEPFDPTGLTVYLQTTLGRRETTEYEILTETPFAAEAGTQTVTVSAAGFCADFSVRILNTEETPVLNSIYATFPEGYDFTYRGDPETALRESGMRVYAVYSTGEERELTADDYTVRIDETRTPFRKTATVTLAYGGRDCSFDMKGEL